MAESYFTILTPVLKTQLFLKLNTFFYITNILLHSFILTFTSTIPISPTDYENYLPFDDPNDTNLIVSHYDCEKQHILRQFNLLNVKQCTEAPNIQHANVNARVYVRAKIKQVKVYKGVAYANKRKKIASKALLNIDV